MNCEFECNKEVIDIRGKRYSDIGINKNKLCRLLGIDKEIIDVYNNWYLLDGKFYYYKNEYIFKELLISELAKVMSVKSVDFKLVMRSGRLGIVSECYRSLNKDYYMYGDFCLKYFDRNTFNLIDFRKYSNVVFGSENTCLLMNDLYGMLAMDLFSGQVDRGEYNFLFECDDKSVRLAPLCDNGRCFGGDMMYRSPFGNFSLYGSMNNSYNDIYNVLNENKDFYFKLSSLLDIDMNDILKRTIDKYNIVINSEYKSYLLGYFDKKKNDIEKVLRRCKK